MLFVPGRDEHTPIPRCHGWRQVTTQERDCAPVSKIGNTKGWRLGEGSSAQHWERSKEKLEYSVASRGNVLKDVFMITKSKVLCDVPEFGQYFDMVLRRYASISRTPW